MSYFCAMQKICQSFVNTVDGNVQIREGCTPTNANYCDSRESARQRDKCVKQNGGEEYDCRVCAYKDQCNASKCEGHDSLRVMTR